MEEKLLVIGEGREVSAVRDIIEALQKEMVLERIHERTEAALWEDWKQLAVRYPVVSVVVADPKKRLRIIAKLEEYCCTIMTLIHPESVVSPAASLGKGCMICPMAVIEAGSVLGTGVWVKAGHRRRRLSDWGCLLFRKWFYRKGWKYRTTRYDRSKRGGILPGSSRSF